ncbi:hypothetical protein U0070_001287, partial [Myodes glareolus]
DSPVLPLGEFSEPFVHFITQWTHLSFISPCAIAPILLDFFGVASGGQ